MTLPRAGVWLVPYLFAVVLLTPVLALAEVSMSASADAQRPRVVALDERIRGESEVADRPATPVTEALAAPTGSRPQNDFLHRPPKHRRNPAWPSQWAFSVRLFVLVGLGVLVFAWRELRRCFHERSSDRLPALGLFVVALVLRFAIPVGPTNWHTHLYGASDPDITARFGPGTWVVQAGLWSLFSPSDVALGRAYAFIGALSVPLLYAIVRAHKASIAVATSVAMFWALSPIHIRISASFSEHVVSSTLTFLLLLVALRGGLFAIAFSALLFIAIGLCRFDAWPQLAMVPIWVALVDTGEQNLDRSSRLWRALSYFALWAGSGIIIKAIFMSDGPSHPLPAMSEVLGELFGLPLWFASHMFRASIHPHWFSPVGAWLMLPGLYWMFTKRRSVLLAVVGALAVSFVPLGRTPGELVTARYFLPALALVLVPAGHGLEWILTRAKLRNPWAWRGVVYVATLACALPALGYRYTFQDEYAFLRNELSRLSPACAVVSLPVRHESMPRDIDCCMSLPLSSLDLALSEMKFVELEDSDTRFSDLDGECLVYYENPICHMDPGVEWEGLWDETMSSYRQRCAEIRENNRLELLARAEFQSELPDPRPLFADKPAQGALYRVVPASREAPSSSAARHSGVDGP